jgi:hypothetical protein
MNATNPTRTPANPVRFRRPIPRRPSAFKPGAFGMETLDLMGIDIDQDPHAFAKLLELTNPAQQGK